MGCTWIRDSQLSPPSRSCHATRLDVLARGGTGEAIGEGMQVACNSSSGHRDAVTGREHAGFEPRECDNGILRSPPIPARHIWGQQDPLLAGQQTPQECGQHGVAGDHHTVALGEEDDVARRMARGGDTLPVRKTRNAGTLVWKGTRGVFEVRSGHPLKRPPRQQAHQHDDESADRVEEMPVG